VALFAGAVAAAILAPGWRTAFGNEGGKLHHFSVHILRSKIGAIGQTVSRFSGLPGAVAALAGVGIVVLLIVLLVVPRMRRTLTERVRNARPGWWTALYFALVTAGGVCLQNLLFLSMPPLITSRYLAMAWPFLAFLPLLFFGLWPRARYALTAAFCLLVLPAAVIAPLSNSSGGRLQMGRLTGADAVLIDNVGVGELPRFLWSVPAHAQVFAGTQKQLLASPQAWSDLPSGGAAYYVSIIRSGNIPQQQASILAALPRTHDVNLVSRNGPVDIFAIAPKASQ
jgi:hypothetical protein